MSDPAIDTIENAVTALLVAAGVISPTSSIEALTVPLAEWRPRHYPAVAVMTDAGDYINRGGGVADPQDLEITLRVVARSSHRRKSVGVKGEGSTDGVMDTADKIRAAVHGVSVTVSGAQKTTMYQSTVRIGQAEKGIAEATCIFKTRYSL